MTVFGKPCMDYRVYLVELLVVPMFEGSGLFRRELLLFCLPVPSVVPR